MRGSPRLRLLLAVMLLTSFTLVTLDYRSGDNSPFHSLRSSAETVFGPVQRAVGTVVRPIGSALGSLPHLSSYKDDADRLKKENERLQQQLRTSEQARSRAAQLDKLLRVTNAGQYPIVPARVVAVGGGLGFEWTATIDAGSRDGLRADMTVLNGDGLVGRIKTVTPYTSTVLLANDPTSSVGARLESSSELGFVTGGGLRPMTLELLSPNAVVRTGDRLVTFGS